MPHPEDSSSRAEQGSWPGLPSALEHRISLKWTSLEAIRILQDRLRHQGQETTVLLLTAMGVITGDVADLGPTYESSFQAETIDVTTAVAHLRTEIWNMYASNDPELEPTDTASLIRVKHAMIRHGARRIRLDEVTLFANEIIGFSLISTSKLV